LRRDVYAIVIARTAPSSSRIFGAELSSLQQRPVHAWQRIRDRSPEQKRRSDKAQTPYFELLRTCRTNCGPTSYICATSWHVKICGFAQWRRGQGEVPLPIFWLSNNCR